jgi:hypothetical protein
MEIKLWLYKESGENSSDKESLGRGNDSGVGLHPNSPAISLLFV